MLLAFLAAVHPGRLVPRDRLAGLLWPDRSDRAAQKTLRNALWRLGCSVPDPLESVAVEGERIGIHPDVWVDVDRFRAGLSETSASYGSRLTADQVARREGALTLYRGDLLEGFDEHWAAGPRQTLRQLRQNALEQLFMHHRAVGELRCAIVRGRQLLRENPFLERVHRELMLCHWALGDRPLAVRQYRACERILRRELDLEPMAETRTLLARIRTDATPPDAGGDGLRVEAPGR
jgi:DNA-binding SARP family transcriptional activator